MSTSRLESLDVLRGFDMFFIMGGASLIVSICALFPEGSTCWLARQMVHVPWHGLAHHDTIFPLFLFIAGATFPFSCAKQVTNGWSVGRICVKIGLRAALLVLFGFLCNGLLDFKLEHFRVWSVLGRIGLAWAGAALAFVFLKTRSRIVLALAILFAYALINRFVGAPDHPGADPFSMEGSITCWLDRVLLPNHIYKPLYDPEGLFGIFPAIVTAMLGGFAGEFLRQSDVTGLKKAASLAGSAIVLAGAAWSMSFLMPINKALWSSSFVLAVGSYSVALLALFYWLIDVKGYKKWAFFFKVIGMNSIAIYMAQRIVAFRRIDEFFLGGLANLLPAGGRIVLLHAGYIAVCWFFLYFLYRKQTFLRV